MDILEADYVSTQNKINTLNKPLKARRLQLNEIAQKLLNDKSSYEFQNHNIVIHRPVRHLAKKKLAGA